MSGIYIHIPFCKQACHYCDYHFSTSLKKKEALVRALIKELELRKDELQRHLGFTGIETIYFGGGTPSLLSVEELRMLIDSVYEQFDVIETPEITIEANPDDLTPQKLLELSNTPINRLSIGIQSFFDDDLKLMNRAHSAQEAKKSLENALTYFNNISIDLIYGIPGASNEQWIQNIETALSYDISHISSYVLTVEPKTALENFVRRGIVKDVDEAMAREQFYILIEKLDAAGFIHYELSNFGKPEFFSRNNTAYWQGKPYLGIGPSAHSFDGERRGWNVRNNSIYIKSLERGELPIEIEVLSITDKYNEYIMTGLRTIWGVDLKKVEQDFGPSYKAYLLKQSQKFVAEHLLYIEDNKLRVTHKGQFLSDGIASDLFKINAF